MVGAVAGRAGDLGRCGPRAELAAGRCRLEVTGVGTPGMVRRRARRRRWGGWKGWTECTCGEAAGGGGAGGGGPGLWREWRRKKKEGARGRGWHRGTQRGPTSLGRRRHKGGQRSPLLRHHQAAFAGCSLCTGGRAQHLPLTMAPKAKQTARKAAAQKALAFAEPGQAVRAASLLPRRPRRPRRRLRRRRGAAPFPQRAPAPSPRRASPQRVRAWTRRPSRACLAS